MRMEHRYSRRVDGALRASVDKDIIEKGGGETTANRAQDRGPEPVAMTIGEHCSQKH